MLISLEISNEDMMISSSRSISGFLTMKTTLWMMKIAKRKTKARMRVRTKIGQVKSILILFYAERSGVKWGFPYRFFLKHVRVNQTDENLSCDLSVSSEYSVYSFLLIYFPGL